MPLALSLSYKNKTIKFDVVGERPATMHIQIGCLQNKRVEKLHRLKSQPMFSEAWRFWLLTNKAGEGRETARRLGREQLVFIFLAASPLVRPVRQNRHATQATQTEWGEPFDFQTGISGFPM